MSKRKIHDDSGFLTPTGRGRRRFIKRSAWVAAGSTPAVAALDALLNARSAKAQAVLDWPTHSPGYISIAPGVGGYGMNTVGGSGRHLTTPDTTLFIVNTARQSPREWGQLQPAFGPNTYECNFEFAIRHAASPKKIYICRSGYFAMGGNLPLQTRQPDLAQRGYVSVLGQFAPQPGFIVRGSRFQTNGGSEIYVSHVRFYVGDDRYSSTFDLGQNRDCVSAGAGGVIASNVVFENCEFGYGIDELVDFTNQHNGVSFVQCAFIEPLHDSVLDHTDDDDPPDSDHGFGLLFGSSKRSTLVAIFRCLFANTSSRTPLTNALRTVIANNLFYNCAHDAIQVRNGESGTVPDPLNLNVLYNMFLRGPNHGSTIVAVKATQDIHPDSRVYLEGNVTRGWTVSGGQAGFVTSGPANWQSGTVLANCMPGSWGSGMSGVLHWAANPPTATLTEQLAFVDLIDRTVGAQPGLAGRPGRLPHIFQNIRNRINGVGGSASQFVNTVAEAGGWHEDVLGSPTDDDTSPLIKRINPLDPGPEWHAPLPTGSNRLTPYTDGVFSDGQSRAGYTPLDAFEYEQKLKVMG